MVVIGIFREVVQFTLTAGTMRDVPTLGFDPQEPTFVVGGVIKYTLMKVASPCYVRWALIRKERAASPPDIEDPIVLRDLWEDKHLLASGFLYASLVGSSDPKQANMIPIRKTTLRDDEELGFQLATEITGTDFHESGVTKVMHKRV